mmetsp:Transcript_23631/g.46986  ORF Transcript_23631/g.46986 Transcript_23631/m.46986 type:complete len:304 (-) Transcript_23631:405-1316(-)
MSLLASPARIAECTRDNFRGTPYQELWCLYPPTEVLYSKFEKSTNEDFYPDHLVWVQNNPAVPLIAVACYVAFITLGPAIMKNREAFNFRKAMASWNLFLSLFSFAGMMRTLPHLLHNLGTMSGREVLCTDAETAYGSGSTGIWVFAFCFSKIPELFDTFFLVAHKKPVIFLHWYHHITVLLYCWHSYATKSPAGLFFIVMNYAVHAIMYGYYYLTCIKAKPKWLNPMIITCAQISQMVVGVVVQLMSFYYYHTAGSSPAACEIKQQNVVAGFMMYGSYLFLFAQFFACRYLTRKKKGPKKID